MSLRKYFKVETTVICLVLICIGCEKFVEIEPPIDRITEGNVFNNDINANTVLIGMYSMMSLYGIDEPGITSVSKLTGLSSDELSLWSNAFENEQAYYKNELKTSAGGPSGGSSAGGEIWKFCYTFIFKCNQAIEGISESESLTPYVKQQLLGEAKFIRAFLYFYLTNLYGDVPLVTGTDPEVNRMLARTDKGKIYEAIISDLQDAQELLNSQYVTLNLKPSTDAERVRPTKWAALALLARVYLYTDKYAEAELTATKVIDEKALFDIVDINSVFLKNNKEAIWQLQPVLAGWNTSDALLFSLNTEPIGFSYGLKTVYLSDMLYQSFESGDRRKTEWIGNYSDGNTNYHFPNKYKAGPDERITATNVSAISEYMVVLRLAEQYLIRAEARSKQSNVTGAILDLNILRTRARDVPSASEPNPLPDLTTAVSDEQLLQAVLKERQVELFTEWGHRWLDLKRTINVDSVMSIVAPSKGTTWQHTDALYPVPTEDILNNPNITQTPGY